MSPTATDIIAQRCSLGLSIRMIPSLKVTNSLTGSIAHFQRAINNLHHSPAILAGL